MADKGGETELTFSQGEINPRADEGGLLIRKDAMEKA